MLRGNEIRSVEQLEGRVWQMWTAEIPEREIADLSTWAKIIRSSLDVDAIVADDYLYCWQLRANLEEEGFRGLLTPSAAHHGSHQVNLILFGPRTTVSASLPGPNPLPEVFIDAAPYGAPQVPPEACLGLTRYRGTPAHRGLEVWKRSVGI